MRLGIFGGTFDPPHLGHLLVARDAVRDLSLDELVIIPASRQPLKTGRRAAPPEARLEMVRLTVACEPRMRVDPFEVDRAGLSYSVETLVEYARRYPDAERFFLMGVDAVRTFASWREPGRVASLARVAVVSRLTEAGESESSVGLEAAVEEMQRSVGLAQAPIIVATRRIDISSTEIRERVRRGDSIRGLVTDHVAHYIESSGLYRQDGT